MGPVHVSSVSFTTPTGDKTARAGGDAENTPAIAWTKQNRTLDKTEKRYEILAKAEAYMLDAQPVIPLGHSGDELDEKSLT